MNDFDEGEKKAEQANHEENGLSPRLVRTNSSEKDLKPEPQHAKLDKHGFPLIPQPSDNKDDPLVRAISPLCWNYTNMFTELVARYQAPGRFSG